MYNKTIRQIIEEGATYTYSGEKRNVSDMVSYLRGYLGEDGKTYDAVIVLNAIIDAARDGIIEW